MYKQRRWFDKLNAVSDNRGANVECKSDGGDSKKERQ